jgi:hypothetical protein
MLSHARQSVAQPCERRFIGVPRARNGSRPAGPGATAILLLSDAKYPLRRNSCRSACDLLTSLSQKESGRVTNTVRDQLNVLVVNIRSLYCRTAS